MNSYQNLITNEYLITLWLWQIASFIFLLLSDVLVDVLQKTDFWIIW